MLKRILLALTLWLGFTAAASAQWQICNNCLAVGQGAGHTGFASLAPTNNAVVFFNGSGAPTAATTLPSGLTLPSPVFSGTATGSIPVGVLAPIAADSLIGNFTGSMVAPGSAAIGNCLNALTYSTSSHAFGCNSTAGTGTVTSISTGPGLSGGPITSSGTINSLGPTYSNVVNFGAVGDGTPGGNSGTDNTTAFQNAYNAAVASGGSQVVYVPPPAAGKCFYTGALNATAHSHVTIMGNGSSNICPNGSSTTNHIWWDFTGSSDVTLKGFQVSYDGAHTPVILFLHAGETGVTNGLLNGIIHNHVNVLTAKWSSAASYFYGLTWDTSTTDVAAEGYSCRDSLWVSTTNGSSPANPSLASAEWVFDGINSRSIASDYVTIATGSLGNNAILANNCSAVDQPSGFGSGTRDNNANIVAVTTGTLNWNGGSMSCVCAYPFVGWANNEGHIFTATHSLASDGSTNTVLIYFLYGGGANSLLTFQANFFSSPVQGYIGFYSPVGGAGGVTNLNVFNPEVGGNVNSQPFVTDGGSCSGAPATWISNSYIQFWSGASAIASCTSIDSHTSLVGVGTVSLGGGTDSSRHQ